MSVSTARRDESTVEAPARPGRERPGGERAGRRRLVGVGAVLVGWVVGWALFQGMHTLALPVAQLNDFHRWLNDVRDSFDAQRNSSFFFEYVIGGVSAGLDWLVSTSQALLTEPAFPRPVPEIGWLGVVALAAGIGFALAGARIAALVTISMLAFGFLGYWEASIDLLIVTAVAVGLCLLIGLPTAIWMARSTRVTTVVTPVLDVMQTMPSFAYLAPLVLFFGIGPASAVVTTLIYALPPLVRIAAHGLRTVSPGTMEATVSMGATSGQLLRKVQLPMARRTILVGLNQTTMAALSIATIAALIDGPGLGQPVIQALQTLDVGQAFVSGLCIVIMAIMLDRLTTAGGVRAELSTRTRKSPKVRRLVLAGSAVAVIVAVYLSRTYLWAAAFPDEPDLGTPLSRWTSVVTQDIVETIGQATEVLKDLVSYGVLNPLQSLMAESPWWLMAAVLLTLSVLLGGVRALLSTAVSLAIILGTGLWSASMETLATTLVATVVVIALGFALGVWMGRSHRADASIRPVLDALQTIPPFVYLVPALALFGVGRFTAIVAAIAYATPVAIKLIADGIRGVPVTTVEAAEAAGSSGWQVIRKVQLPMAKGSAVLAANQGLLFVLAMVVIGGLVGGGGLGFLVVSGFSQAEDFGKGLAAGIAITALGVMLDRITKHTAARFGRVDHA